MKQKMNLIGMMLLITLSSCAFPTIRKIERCVVSTDFDKVRCHQYEISKENIGRVSESYDLDIDHINNGIAFTQSEWKALRVWFEEIYLWLNDRNKEAKHLDPKLKKKVIRNIIKNKIKYR